MLNLSGLRRIISLCIIFSCFVLQAPRVESSEALQYTHEDINEYINFYLDHGPRYRYLENSTYLLTLAEEKATLNPITDEEDKDNYYVAITGCVNNTGENHYSNANGNENFKVSSLNLTYFFFFFKREHVADELKEARRISRAIRSIAENSPDNVSSDNKLNLVKTKIEGSTNPVIHNLKSLWETKETTYEEVIEALQQKANDREQWDVFDELFSRVNPTDAWRLKILFPYNQELPSHWLTAEIKLAHKSNDYQLDVFLHNPYGGGKMEDSSFIQLRDAIQQKLEPASLNAINHTSPYFTPRQQDDFSCGVLVADELIKRIDGQNLNPQKTTSYGALELRHNHVNLFLQATESGEKQHPFVARNMEKINLIEGKLAASKKEAILNEKESEDLRKVFKILALNYLNNVEQDKSAPAIDAATCYMLGLFLCNAGERESGIKYIAVAAARNHPEAINFLKKPGNSQIILEKKPLKQGSTEKTAKTENLTAAKKSIIEALKKHEDFIEIDYLEAGQLQTVTERYQRKLARYINSQVNRRFCCLSARTVMRYFAWGALFTSSAFSAFVPFVEDDTTQKGLAWAVFGTAIAAGVFKGIEQHIVNAIEGNYQRDNQSLFDLIKQTKQIAEEALKGTKDSAVLEDKMKKIKRRAKIHLVQS